MFGPDRMTENLVDALASSIPLHIVRELADNINLEAAEKAGVDAGPLRDLKKFLAHIKQF